MKKETVQQVAGIEEPKQEMIRPLKRIINELQPLDWQVETYPGSANWRLQFNTLLLQDWRHADRKAIDILRMLDGMKTSRFQHIEISLKKIFEKIRENNLIVWRTNETFFIYDGQWWEIPHGEFEDFLGEAAEKMEAPAGLEKEMRKEFINNNSKMILDEGSVTEAIRKRIKK